MVGNAIGSNDVKLAKKYFRMTSTITLVIILLISTIVFVAAKPIVALFTKEADIYDLTLSVIPIVALKFIWDGM